jgi:hypothetical protein
MITNSRSVRSGEREKLAARYQRFNFDALIDVAVKAAGNEATSCKLKFGLNTRATIKSVAESCPIIGINVLKCVEG